MKYIITTFLYFTLLLNSYSECIKGEGNIIEDKIYLPKVTSIIVNVPMNLVLTPSQSETILVKSNKEVLNNLKFEYNDGELDITKRADLCPQNLTIFISLEKVNSIEINSVCKLTTTGKFKTEDFELDINGSADIDFSIDAEDIDIEFEGSGSLNLSGISEYLEVSLDGNGSIDASKMISDEIDVSLDGNGIIMVHPKNSLKANLNGNGKILYKNKPEVLEIEKDGNGIIDKMK